MNDFGALLVIYLPVIWWQIFLWLMRDDEKRAEARRREQRARG
jgi:hypothetical protein